MVFIGGDIGMAIFYYKRCAMSDIYGDAQYWLGKWYYEGKVVARDYDQAFRYISRTAANDELGNDMRLEMMRKLATCYRNGQGTKVDTTMAEKWLKNSDLLENGCYALLYDEFGVPYAPKSPYIDVFFMHKKADEGKNTIEGIFGSIKKGENGRLKLPYSSIGEVIVLEQKGYERIEFKFEPGIKLYLKRKE